MTEAALAIKVRAAVKKYYPEAFIWKIHDISTAGLPDFLFIIQGKHIFIELKIFKSETTRLQEYIISRIKECGGHAFVCRSTEEVLKAIYSI